MVVVSLDGLKAINMKRTSLACSVSFLSRKLETAYGRMKMFISSTKGEIEKG